MRRLTVLTLGLTLAGVASAADVDVKIRQKGDAAPVHGAKLVVGGTWDAEHLTPVGGTPVTLDAEGRATVDLPDGVEVTLHAYGTNHTHEAVVLTPPVDKPVRFFLKPIEGPPEIVVEAFRPRSDLTRHHVDAEQAYETPGTYDDAVRLVQALPGVNIQREYAPSSGDVSVRGSLPGDNRYYLDGIEVPYLYHFNQYASVFPASQLDSLDLYSSTYGARYGDSVGAIVEAVSDTDRPEDVTGSVGINMVTVGGTIRAPLPKGWWIGASFRRSFHDIIPESSLQFPVFPSFYDFGLRAEHDGESVDVGIFTAGAGDRYDRAVGELDILDPVQQTEAPTLSYQRDWQLLGTRVDFDVPKLAGRFTTAFLHDHDQGSVSTRGREDVRTMSLPTRLDMRGTALPDKLFWEAGVELRPEVAIASVEDAGVAGALITTEIPAAAWGTTFDTTAFRGRFHGYGELQAQMGPVRLMPGVRFGVDTLGVVGTIEPRLATRIRVAPQTELRLAGGRYQQRPETLQLLADPTLPTTNSWQVGGGLDQTIAGRVEIIAEGYGKFLEDVVWQPVDGPPQVADRGVAYGGELTLRYRLREVFFAWAWFAYGRSLLYDGSSEFPTRADQPYSGGIVLSWNILPQLNVAARYRIASGLPFTDIAGSVYDATRDTWQPTYGAPFADRMPLYMKIDLRLGYTFVMKRWSLDAYLDVWIVPPTSAQLYPAWNHDFRERQFVSGPAVLPLIGLKANF